jgi:hypothetical protein
MSSLPDRIDNMEKNIESIAKILKTEDIKRVKKKEFKLFGMGMNFKVNKASKQGKVLCIFLHANKNMTLKVVNIVDGLVEIDIGLKKYQFKAFEPGAVYRYKKWPVIVAFEWRLLLAGGIAEEYMAEVIGGDDSVAAAKELDITSFGQETTIRAIEKAELEKDQPKKKGMGMWIWILVGGVALYFIAKSAGWV